MIRVVVFDFDGTLADTNAIKEGCLQRTVATLPNGPAVLMMARQAGGDRHKVFAEVARQLARNCDSRAIAAQTRALVDIYSRCCTKGIVAAAERRGARQTLTALAQRGMRLWVLSATPDRYLREVLRRRGLTHRLRGSFGSSVSKERGLLKIMKRERISRNALLLVGDGPDDHRAAGAIGVKFVAITAENRIAERSRFAMRDLRPLVPLIDRLNGRSVAR